MCLTSIHFNYFLAEEDNKLKDRIYDEDQIAEHRESEQDQDEAKYSPEEKSIVEKSEVERTPTPSEDSEEDEGTHGTYVSKLVNNIVTFTILQSLFK